jgi:hypothetical protein
MLGDPGEDGFALVDLDRVVGLGCRGVVDEDHGGVRGGGQLADETVVRAGIPEHPSAAVAVDDRGRRGGEAGRPHDADRHLPGRPAGDHAVLDARWPALGGGGRLERG